MTDDEINLLASDLKTVADENLLLIAEKEGNPIDCGNQRDLTVGIKAGQSVE